MMKKIGQLVFIRHGQAEAAAADDDLRPLTKAGREDVQQIIPDLKRFRSPDLPLHLWASPKLRAVQTAEMIAAGMGSGEILRQDFIASGDDHALSQAVLQLERPFCLLIVGHQPHLSSWSQRIANRQLPFAKGAAVGYTIESLEPLQAEPMWMIQPKAVCLEEVSVDIEGAVGLGFANILCCQLQEIFRQQEEFLVSPADPEATHRLRVKIRGLRSLLSFIKPLIDPTEYKEIQTNMKEAARLFAHLREIDVLKEEWTALLAVYPRLDNGSGALMKLLQRKREAEQTGVYQRVEAGLVAARLFNLLSILDSLSADHHPWANATESERTFVVYAQKRFASQRKKAKRCFADTDFQDLNAIHALRIRCKKLRYVSAILRPYLKIRNKEENSFKILQDRLGRVVDAQRNLELLWELQTRDGQPGLAYDCGILTGYQMQAAEGALHELKKK